MITPTHAGNSPMYDPLAVQFMTQGQMGYMPDAQYLTPHDYGAFRTMPGMNMMGAMPHHQMSMWQAYTIQNMGRLPFTGKGGTPYIFDVYNPGAEQSWYQTMALRRWQDAKSAMGGGVGDVMARMGAAAGLGGIPGIATGLLMPDVFSPYMDRIRGMREIQGQSIPRIMTGPDVAQGLGYGFSAPAARRLDSSMREMGAQDYIYKQEDYRELYRLGMEQGLFDFDITSGQHEQTLKTLRNNVEIMGKLLGSTDFKELTKAMKRLLDMGMDPAFMASATRLQAMSGFTAGMSVEAMSSAYGQPGAMAFSQVGLTPYLGSFAAMSSAAGMEISRRLGIVNPAEVARLGGVSGFTQSNVNTQANIWKGGLGNTLLASVLGPDMQIDPQLVQGLVHGDVGSLGDLFRRAAEGAGQDYVAFELNKESLRHDMLHTMGPLGQELALFHVAQLTGQEAIGKDRSLQEQLTTGYKIMGYDQDLAETIAKMQSSREYMQAKKEEQEKNMRHIRENAMVESAYEEAPLRSMGVWFRTISEAFGERVYGSRVAEKAWINQMEEDAQRGFFRRGGEESFRAFHITKEQAKLLAPQIVNFQELSDLLGGVDQTLLEENIQDIQADLSQGVPLFDSLQNRLDLSPEEVQRIDISDSLQQAIAGSSPGTPWLERFSPGDLSNFVDSTVDTWDMLTYTEKVAFNRTPKAIQDKVLWRMDRLLDSHSALQSGNIEAGTSRFIETIQDLNTQAGLNPLSEEAINARLASGGFKGFGDFNQTKLGDLLGDQLNLTDEQVEAALEDNRLLKDTMSAIGLNNPNWGNNTAREYMERVGASITGQEDITDIENQHRKLLHDRGLRGEVLDIVFQAQKSNAMSTSILGLSELIGMGDGTKPSKRARTDIRHQAKVYLGDIGAQEEDIEALSEKIAQGTLTPEERKQIDERVRGLAQGDEKVLKAVDVMYTHGRDYGKLGILPYRTQRLEEAGRLAQQVAIVDQVRGIDKRMGEYDFNMSDLQTEEGREKIREQYSDNPQIQAWVNWADTAEGPLTTLDMVLGLKDTAGFIQDSSLELTAPVSAKEGDKAAYDMMHLNLQGITNILESQALSSRNISTHMLRGNEQGASLEQAVYKLIDTLELVHEKL